MASSSKDAKPLPLSATLRDLAVLRVSGLDLSSLVPTPATFIQAARSAIKVQIWARLVLLAGSWRV
ncbi:hypothetical protein CPB85DRAFT_1435914 [Mucidula mucida]|nr:hypothetical protein CPB85DRAFT_1435914 [Mucidula mucida]